MHKLKCQAEISTVRGRLGRGKPSPYLARSRQDPRNPSVSKGTQRTMRRDGSSVIFVRMDTTARPRRQVTRDDTTIDAVRKIHRAGVSGDFTQKHNSYFYICIGTRHAASPATFVYATALRQNLASARRCSSYVAHASAVTHINPASLAPNRAAIFTQNSFPPHAPHVTTRKRINVLHNYV